MTFRSSTFFIALAIIFSTLFHNAAWAVVVISEDFENPSGFGSNYTTTGNVNVVDGQNDFFARIQIPNVADPTVNSPAITTNFTQDFTGFGGNFYWAGEDHDDPQVGNGTAELALIFDDKAIPTTPDRSLKISVLLGGHDGGNIDVTTGPYDAGQDFVRVSYRLDNGPLQTALEFLPSSTNFLQEVTDYGNDGLDILGSELKEFSVVVPRLDANTFDLIISSHSNSSSEEWAVDNVSVSTVPEPSAFLFVGLVSSLALSRRRKRRQ